MVIKKLVHIFTCVLVITGVVGMLVISKIPSLPENPSKEKLISFFNKNRSLFDRMANYLKEIEGDISFDKRDGDDISSIGRIVTEDGVKIFSLKNEIKEDVKKLLYEYDFTAIYEEDKYIYFVKFAGFQWHKSLVYSKNGETPLLNKMRDFEEIDKGWYYYEGE